ncbi:MAG: ACP S-malonyltransferase [Paracoccaceae bacterium]
MKKTAVVVAPGRGTYNRGELGYLKRLHSEKQALIREFDTHRTAQDQPMVTDLDGADRFSQARHTTGDNASPLIYACSYADFLSIDRDRIDIVAVTGNSMGWYTTLACAGAVDALGGFQIVNTMGTLMQDRLIGGQLIYPFVDENWHPNPGRREQVLALMDQINNRPDHVLTLSIALGGMVVMAGNEAGLAAVEAELPRVQDRFPMRLPNHAAFHTALQAPVAEEGRNRLPRDLFQQPDIPMIDGRGYIWQPKASDLTALYDYTLGHQVVEPYDFTTAIQTAAREFMPDLVIILGPGTTLGGATAQSLALAGWRGVSVKSDFKADDPLVVSMGDVDHRALATG